MLDCTTKCNFIRFRQQNSREKNRVILHDSLEREERPHSDLRQIQIAPAGPRQQNTPIPSHDARRVFYPGPFLPRGYIQKCTACTRQNRHHNNRQNLNPATSESIAHWTHEPSAQFPQFVSQNPATQRSLQFMLPKII
jgi:hypothetical protein